MGSTLLHRTQEHVSQLNCTVACIVSEVTPFLTSIQTPGTWKYWHLVHSSELFSSDNCI